MLAILIVNGTPPADETLREYAARADLLVAADGAAEALRRIGVLPDVLVGDMDSADPKTVEFFKDMGVEMLYLPREKDEPDTRRALRLIWEHGADEVVILGALGGRLDHMLSNLMLLEYAMNLGLMARIADRECDIAIYEKDVRIKGKIGSTVSIFPVNGTAVVTCLGGLQYPLESLVLNSDDPIGLSNVFIKPEAELVIKGRILVIWIK